MSLLAALVSLALGQSPLPPGPGMAPIPVAPAASKWTAGETPSTRFPDASTAGPTFPAGAMVVLLVTEGDRVRIQKGDLVGWVSASALTDAAPPPPVLPPLELPK